MPLYATAIALLMHAFGEAAWVGEVLSLFAMLVAALALHDVARRRYVPAVAFLAPAVLLASHLGVDLAISVMRDATCLAFCALALRHLVCVGRDRRSTDLVAMAAFTALAGLLKPTGLQLGITQGL